MDDLTSIQILLVVNVYLILAFLLFVLSTNDLVCCIKNGTECARAHRIIKFIVALPLMLSCLALLAFGLFIIGMSHSSRPEEYQVVLFILGCLVFVILLILWVFGSLWLDVLWVVIVSILLGYLLFFNPSIYVQYWADSNSPWAQMWMARHYSAGTGGLTQSKSTARRWYSKAAENNNKDAQYLLASRARRKSEAIKWYLLAAEQGHVGAMVQMATLGRSDEERQYWLKRAGKKGHPDAVFLEAQNAMNHDLPLARRLLLDAAENGSHLAIAFLIIQYRQGGVLFDQNEASANHWRSVLENTPESTFESVHLDQPRITLSLDQAQELGNKITAGDMVTLYKQAQMFLRHPAKDLILHDRAIEYLTRAANSGHEESALELARLATQNDKLAPLNRDALNWYILAASTNNVPALKKLVRYYKDQPNTNLSVLEKALEYNNRLLDVLQTSSHKTKRFEQQHWAGEHRDTKKRIDQLKRLGGSWQTAAEQAEKDPQKEYQLAKELLKDRQYAVGMQHMKSAAQRGNKTARLELALKVLRGPRSFSEEISAISELQALDKVDYFSASIELGALYQSGTGVVPQNYYLARNLFRKAQADPLLSEKANRWLNRTPKITDSLKIKPSENPSERVNKWYQHLLLQGQGSEVLRKQYETLLDHFGNIDVLRSQAALKLAESKFKLAQVLQSHNLAEAIRWLEQAASDGDVNAQYELAVRMIRGKKNTLEQQQSVKTWAHAAAESGHVGAMVFLAIQYKNGSTGFERDIPQSKQYYLRALQSTDVDTLYQGKIAGRQIKIMRSNIQKDLTALNE